MTCPCRKRKPRSRTRSRGAAAMKVFCTSSGIGAKDSSLECGGHAAAVRAPAWPAHSTSLPFPFQLPLVNPPYLIDRRDLIDRLVVADARDPREAQRVPRLVPRRLLDAVERDLQNDRRLDEVHRPVARGRRLLEMLGEAIDLDVGQAGVGLADVHQLVVA